MKPSVIVIGPQGCGKTRHAARIAVHFGLTRIVDGGLENFARWKKPLEHGVLYLTNEPPPPRFKDIKLVQFAQVVREIELQAAGKDGA